MTTIYRFLANLLIPLCLIMFTFSVSASAVENEKFNVVIHLSKNLKANYYAAITQAQILQKNYGKENINIEILVNGTAVGFVNRQNQYVKPIKNLMSNGVRFSACNATIRRILKDKNFEVPLIDGVQFVPYGVVRLIELQRQGYYYLKP